jgi:thioredoxin 1
MHVYRDKRLLIVLLLLLAASLSVVSLLRAEKQSPCCSSAGADVPGASVAVNAALPRLVDVGAAKCIPCKMMAPILEELKKEYAGRLDVVFVDVWKYPDEAKKYGVRTIPTQIFYVSGKEVTRHQGYISKGGILKTFENLGVSLQNETKS